MKSIKQITERVRKIDLGKIKQAADAVSKFIEIVVGIVMSVMLGVVGIQQNLSMEQQEQQLAMLQLEMDAKTQIPSFRLAENYDVDGFSGYTVINDGRRVTCLDVRIEKWMYIEIMGNPAIGFIVPYNAVSRYIAEPERQEAIGFRVERMAIPAEETVPLEHEEGEMPIENELPVKVDLMDVQPFVGGLEAALRAAEKGYQIRTMEVMTLTYVDQEQAYEMKRYFVGAEKRKNPNGNEVERPLYLIDEKTWDDLLSQIPEAFERMPQPLNGSVYSHAAHSGAEWRKADDLWQTSLAEEIMGYIDQCTLQRDIPD